MPARSSIAASEAGQMAVSDYVPVFLKNRFALGAASTDDYMASGFIAV